MKENVSTRLKKIMSQRNLKQVDILELSKPYQKKLDIKMSKSHLSQYVNGKSTPDQHKLYLLSETLKVNEAWLMGYNVPELKSEQNVTADKDDIKIIYSQLNKKRKEKVYHFAEEQLAEQKNNVVDLRKYKDLYIQSTVSAGTGIVDLEQQYKELISYDGYVPKKYDLSFKISGDSMEPFFKDGEIIFVKYDKDIRNGQIGVVLINDEAFVKKMYVEDEKLKLISLNKKYNDIEADEKDDIQVIGRVIF